MTDSTKRYLVDESQKFADVKCPNIVCGNNFIIQTYTLHRNFICAKCGSEWYGDLKDK